MTLNKAPAYTGTMKEGYKQLHCAHDSCKRRTTFYCIQCSYLNFGPKVILVRKACQITHASGEGIAERTIVEV